MSDGIVRTSGMFHEANIEVLEGLSAQLAVDPSMLICYAVGTSLERCSILDVIEAIGNVPDWFDDPKILGLRAQGNFYLPLVLRDQMQEHIKVLRADAKILKDAGVLGSGVAAKCTRSLLINLRLQAMKDELLDAGLIRAYWHEASALVAHQTNRTDLGVTLFDHLEAPQTYSGDLFEMQLVSA